MGEVKMFHPDVGYYRTAADYARLERERDHYKAFHDETIPALKEAQGLRNRLESTERAMAAQAAELTRLRAVEAAAVAYVESIQQCLDPEDPPELLSLAEACGRKG